MIKRGPRFRGFEQLDADPQRLERFKRAWNDGVPIKAMAERFGMNKGSITASAKRLGLKSRGRKNAQRWIP